MKRLLEFYKNNEREINLLGYGISFVGLCLGFMGDRIGRAVWSSSASIIMMAIDYRAGKPLSALSNFMLWNAPMVMLLNRQVGYVWMFFTFTMIMISIKKEGWGLL